MPSSYKRYRTPRSRKGSFKRRRRALFSIARQPRITSRKRVARYMRHQAGTLGKTLRQKFRFSQLVRLDAGLATLASQTYSANGLYDPDVTGVGHQPIGFDQLVGVFYNHYTVLSSRIKVQVMSTNADPSLGQSLLMIEASGSPTPDTNKRDVLDRNGGSAVTAGGAMQSKTVYRSVNISRFLGQSVMQEDANAGTSSANPSEQVYWHIYSTGADDVNNPSVVNCLVTIDYIAVLHEPKNLTGS